MFDIHFVLQRSHLQEQASEAQEVLSLQSRELVQVQEALKSKADRRHMEHVVNTLSACVAEMQTKASASALERTVDDHASTRRLVTTVQAQVQGVGAEVAKRCTALGERIDGKASIEDANSKADAASCDKILIGLREMINRKAEDVEVDKVGEQLGALEERCAALQQHVGVAVRFVEWFSERG